MKNISIFIFAGLLILPSILWGQAQDKLPHSSDKAFHREQWFKSAREDEQGSMKSYLQARRLYSQGFTHRGNDFSNFTTQWYPLGPSKTTAPVLAQLGLVSALHIDTTDYVTLYAGSNTGGLFKTTDGGENWYCLTDTVFTTGILSIHVDPRDKNRILIGTGHYSFERSYGVGMLESNDGGRSWHQTGLNNQAIPYNYIVQKSGMHPDNPDHLIALVNAEARFRGKVFKSTDGAVTWQETYGVPGAEFFSIAYTPGSSETIYVSGNRLLKSMDEGDNWTDLTHLISLDTNFRPTRIAISIAPAAPDSVLVFCEAEDTTLMKSNRKYLFLSDDGALTFKQIQLRGDPFCSYWKMQLVYSPTRSDEFYLGGMWLYKYRITGDSALFIGNSLHTYHKDVRDLAIFPFEGNDKVYMANDGGITLSNDGTATYQDITRNGMQILQLYNITADDNSDNVFGGPQDGNICFYNTKTGEWWKHPRIGDAYDGMINYNNPNEVYLVIYPPRLDKPHISLMKSTDNGLNFSYLSLPDSTDPGRKDKPVAMDPTDPQVIYVGTRQVWKSTNGGQTFERISNFTVNQNLKTLKVSPSNPQVIVAAFENPSWSNINQPKLMITPDGGNRWFDITPRGQLDLRYAGIADVAFHPDSSLKIWLALDRLWTDRRVYVTDNGGISWKNYSQGMPSLPVNVIRYVKGADNNLLLAGTDAGVYFRDNSMEQWAYFGKGLPHTIVSDLEINYKRKKVLAATYGRGLWEADLCLPVSNSAITITENTVWERDKNMLHDVIIAAGATLTITATIEMGDDRTIKVMPGGQLIINGGKLTANCINLWQGIRLYGHADFGDTTLPQAKLSMNYGATIEKARIAVECMAVNDTAHSCPQGGGVIYANRSYFTNNIQSILMHPGIGINPSEFKFCRFTNNELIEGQGPEAQVELNGIQGVHFTSCQFENLIPVNLLQLPDRGCGIRSFNSWFVVSKAVVNDSLPFAPSADPLFKQFNCGIDARFSHPGYALVLDGIRFDRNYTGVYISGAGLANISNCKIKTLQSGSTGNYKPVSAGIYLDHCNLYNISLNQFTGNVSGLAPLLFPSAAMIINNCGAANNLISGNKINKCSVGLMAQNQNRSPDGSNGLRVLNNWFNSNIFDVAITADSSEVNVGIALRQGSLPSGETAPAGNHFSYSRHQREGDFRNQGPDIRYYCYNDSLMHQLPRMYARISPVPVAVSFPGDSTYLPSWITDIPDMEKLETWDRITETIQDRQKELVDGGDTPGLQLRTIAHMGDDSPDFFKTLNRYSPYLSYPVIQALVKNNYFPNKMLLEILLKNCHSVRLPGLLELLKQRFPEMPGWMQYNLVNCYQQYSGLEHLESEVEMSKAIRNGVYNLASANLFLQESPDDIPQAWQSILYKQNTVESELSRAFSSLFAGDTTLAPGILLNAGYIDESSDYNTEEWLSIYKLNLKIIYDNLNCLPDSLLMNELTNSNSPMHTFYLKNLLHHLDVVTYHEPYIFPGKLPGVILPEIPDPAINSTFIEVYPVPAQSFFILNYQSDTGLEAAGIQIFDLNGRQLDFIALNKEYDQKFIPVSHLKSGIYILRIRLNAHTTIYRKLLIAR